MRRMIVLIAAAGAIGVSGEVIARIDHESAVRCEDNRTVLIREDEGYYGIDGEYFPTMKEAIDFACRTESEE